MSTVSGSGAGEGEMGVFGESILFEGVRGMSHAANHGAVVGTNDNQSDDAGAGVFGLSERGEGVRGVSSSPFHAAVVGTNDTAAGVGVFGKGGALAGQFQGNVEVTGDLMLTGGDVAEQFDIATQSVSADETGPGTVVVLDGDGALTPCARPYDTCVAGVVSGAGDRVPALILDRNEEHGEDSGGAGRREIAVVGKVWCQSEASNRPIRVGDLLTTSSMPGHAMAAVDREAAFGAVLGKALTPLDSDTGLVLTLVGLA